MNRLRHCFLWLATCFLAFSIDASASPEIDYNLSLNGDLWGHTLSSSFRLDGDFALTGMNMNLTGAALRAEAGDISASWDELGVAGRNFQGVNMGFDIGKSELSLLGGSVIVQPDILRRPDPLQEQRSQAIVSPVYGVRAAVPAGEKLRLSAAQLFTPRAPGGQGQGISTLAADFTPSEKHRLGFEFARSAGGTGWQVSGSSERKRLRLRGSFRQVHPEFSTAGNPILRTRRSGGMMSLQYRLAQSLTWTAFSQRYTDGWGGHTNHDMMSLRFMKKKQPSLNLYWRSAETARSKATSRHEGETDYQTLGFRIDHSLKKDRVSFQYDRYNFNSSIKAAESDANLSTGTTSDRFRFGWTRPLGSQTQLSLMQVLDFHRTDQQEKGRSLYTSIDLRHRLRNSGLQLNAGLQYANRVVNDDSGQALALRAGFNYRMRSGDLLGLQYRTRLTSSGSMRSPLPDRIYLSYAHQLGGRKRNSHLSQKERRRLGKVLGKVFEDTNLNGKWDAGEAGVSDVEVRVRGSAPQKTDAHGRFTLSELRTGEHHFQMSPKTLPIEFTTVVPAPATVTVAAGQSTAVEVPVVRTGRVTGKVILDVDRDGVAGDGETGAGGAIVKVEGHDVIGFTEPDGSFELHGLPPRTNKIAVDVSAFAEEYVATGNGYVEVVVPSNGAVEGIILGIAPRERNVITTFEKAAN